MTTSAIRERVSSLGTAAAFGLPLVLGIGAHAIFQLVDTLLIGQLGAIDGPRAISVAGLCDPITTLQAILFNGPIAGAGILLATASGKKDAGEFKDIAQRSAGFIMVIAVVTGALGFIFAQEIAQLMGAQSGWQIELCKQYLQVFLAGGFTAGLFLYLSTIDRSAGRTPIFMAAFFISNALNVLLGLLFIYGSGPTPDFVPEVFPKLAESLNIPRMGVMGSAWSTVIARGVTALAIFSVLAIRGELRFNLRQYAPRGGFIRRIMRIGIWNNGQLAIWGIAIGGMIRIVQWVSGGNEKVVAGLFIAIKIDLLLTLLAVGWGTAAQTKVATALANGNFKQSTQDEGNQLLLALLFNTPFVILVFLFPDVIAGWFTEDAETKFWAMGFLLSIAAALILMPIAVVVSQSLVSRGKLRLPVILDGTFLILGMLPLMIIFVLVGEEPGYLMFSYAFTMISLGFAYAIVYARQRAAAGR
ncbi:MAG: hypothetical protein L3J82_04850 [Planctomycetes bacterium]|nr:hypothetical protein [Planctomycetota bacterium]